MQIEANWSGFSVISLLGLIILTLYYILIFKGQFTFDDWWFGLNKNKTFMKIFSVSATLAAIGFLWFAFFLSFQIGEDDINKPEFQRKETLMKINTEVSISLLGACLWPIGVYYYLKTSRPIFKIIQFIGLGITAGAAIAAVAFTFQRIEKSTKRDLAIAGLCLFCFHTFFIDFIIYNLAIFDLI